MILVDAAREFAIERHGAQKYGEQPYAVHLQAVVDILRTVNSPDIVLAAGWLHDVVEDTSTSIIEIVDRFGWIVGMLVACVSGVGKNRKERMAGVCARIVALHREFPGLDIGHKAATLKLADRLANGRSCVESNPKLLAMYRSEWPAFVRGLHVPLAIAHMRIGDPRLWEQLGSIMTDPLDPTHTMLSVEKLMQEQRARVHAAINYAITHGAKVTSEIHGEVIVEWGPPGRTIETYATFEAILKGESHAQAR